MTTAEKHKVVALVSGGKDSTMNILECLRHGHEIIALANLFPSDTEELDSYMYQSVGHDAINAYAECAGLPLFRRAIRGKPVNQNYGYSATEGDEVEDLFELLKEVQMAFPAITAVSSGAIHSTYQKNRVEDVCARLGWTSLAYLWGAEQKSLLRSMIDTGIDAVLIKTAVMGLTRDDLLKSIKEVEPRLHDLESRYGINVCGEGGEFESLTLDCPLFKTKRLMIYDCKIVCHKDDQFAPVNFVKITGITTVPKS